MEMKSVCFTGHRNVKETAGLTNNLLEQLVKLIAEGAEVFYAGGAVGWDMLCERAVIELREKYPHIKLHLVLPCPAEEQTVKWSESDKRKFMNLLSAADMVEVCSEHYYDGCMKVRNQWLVDLSDVCVCYYNESNKRSGTGQTVRMAERKNIRIINLVAEGYINDK